MTIKRRYVILVWLVGSLLAIAVIGDYLTAGLLIAIVTGIVFGVVNFLSWQNTK